MPNIAQIEAGIGDIDANRASIPSHEQFYSRKRRREYRMESVAAVITKMAESSTKTQLVLIQEARTVLSRG